MRDRTREIDNSKLKGKYRKALRKTKPPLSRTHPEVATQWHPNKNGHLGPDDITYGSNVKVWWLCPVHPSHEWAAAANSRCPGNGEQGSGCPFCSGNKVCVTNSLATLFPQIAAQWHPDWNKKLTPADFTGGSNRAVWWQCKMDEAHVWRCNISSRTGHDTTGCPFCSNKRVSKTNSLAAVFPKLAADWHPTKNGKLTARQILAGSHQVVWWRCKKEPHHEWKTNLKSRVDDRTGCPFCTGRKPTQTNNLAALYPEIASEWHPVKNKLSPWSVVPGSHVSIWWRCSIDPTHEWRAKPVSRTRTGSGCPDCAVAKKGPKPRSGAYNFAKLFPQIAKQWHPTKNGDLKPSDVTPGSNKVVWWKCARGSDHVWQTMVNSRAKGNTGCPFCSNRKISKNNSLALRYPEIAAEWHPSKNGILTPSQITASTKKRIWWQCPKNKRHSWEATIGKRIRRGQRCPHCKK